MEEEIKRIIAIMVQQIKDHVPDYGDFTPIMEFFPNPDKLTKEFVGTYGLKVYKMPKDVVPDPRTRYIQAAAYIPSGIYKSTYNVASGTKEELISILQDPKFAEKLKAAFRELEETFEHYD